MTQVWGMVDDRTGHTGQVLGVIAALGLPYALKRLEYNRLAALPTVILGATKLHVAREERATIRPPYPPIVIAAGRRMVPVLRAIKHHAPKTFTVYLMKPEVSEGIDLIVMPEHDAPPAWDKVITTVAPLHAVTAQTLQVAARAWAPVFSNLPHPRITCCLGGNTKLGAYSPADWRELISRAQGIAGGGSLLITTSRRTPPEVLDFLAPLITTPHVLHRWDRDKDNPYLGMLALADGVIVMGDSLSMCAEATAAGKPVFILSNDRVCPPKHQALHQVLFSRGLAQPLNALAALSWKPAAPLNDMGRVAAEIRRRAGLPAA